MRTPRVLPEAGCGNGDGSGSPVVDPQPAGQALGTVDGREDTLTEPAALACTLADDSITFSFRIRDNEATLGAGANRTDDEWFGDVDLRVANPSDEEGPITYFPELPADRSGMPSRDVGSRGTDTGCTMRSDDGRRRSASSRL